MRLAVSRKAELIALGSLAATLFYGASLAFAQAKNWKEQWDKTLSAAKKEGKVVVFGPPGELIRDAMIDGFKKAFPGIDIEYSGGRGGEQATKLKAERDGGIYSVDVFLTGTTTANEQLKPMKAQDPILPALILPEVIDVKNWRDNRLDFSDNQTKYNLVFVSQLKAPLIYDPKQAKEEEVDELQDLLDPKWKGKLVINDPLPSGAGNVTFRFFWKALGPEKATDYYRKLKAQAAVVDRDQRRQIEWVAQGKYPVLLAPSDGTMQQLLQRGLKFGVLGEFKDHGTLITPSFGSANLINRAPQPNAAKVFLNWVLGKEGQYAWSKAMNHVSRRLDVPSDHIPPYQVPRLGVKYWLSYYEEEVNRTDEEEKILKELFGR